MERRGVWKRRHGSRKLGWSTLLHYLFTASFSRVLLPTIVIVLIRVVVRGVWHVGQVVIATCLQHSVLV